jgi:hypothetical protein
MKMIELTNTFKTEFDAAKSDGKEHPVMTYDTLGKDYVYMDGDKLVFFKKMDAIKAEKADMTPKQWALYERYKEDIERIDGVVSKIYHFQYQLQTYGRGNARYVSEAEDQVEEARRNLEPHLWFADHKRDVRQCLRDIQKNKEVILKEDEKVILQHANQDEEVMRKRLSEAGGMLDAHKLQLKFLGDIMPKLPKNRGDKFKQELINIDTKKHGSYLARNLDLD